MTTIYKVGTQTIRPGKAWTDQTGVTHPASWHTYSAAQKAALGITEIVQQPHPDSRLYTWSYNEDGSVSSTAKPLADVHEVNDDGSPMLDSDGNQVVTLGVKSALIAEVKAQQGSLLAQTDWAIVRKADTGIDVPAAIQQWRNEIRLAASLMEDAISQAATTDAIDALFLLYTRNDDGSVSKTGVLYDWPELSA
jgi:hypothetical protein